MALLFEVTPWYVSEITGTISVRNSFVYFALARRRTKLCMWYLAPMVIVMFPIALTPCVLILHLADSPNTHGWQSGDPFGR